MEELIPELKELKAIRYNKGKPRIGLVPPELKCIVTGKRSEERRVGKEC